MSWLNKLIRYILPSCPSCSNGKVSYDHEEWTDKVWISVYSCDKCNKWFV